MTWKSRAKAAKSMICDTTKNFTHILIEESWQIKSATKQQEVIKDLKEQKMWGLLD